jgi:hypothetical protein
MTHVSHLPKYDVYVRNLMGDSWPNFLCWSYLSDICPNSKKSFFFYYRRKCFYILQQFKLFQDEICVLLKYDRHINFEILS